VEWFCPSSWDRTSSDSVVENILIVNECVGKIFIMKGIQKRSKINWFQHPYNREDRNDADAGKNSFCG
jgi:hypothetical protein